MPLSLELDDDELELSCTCCNRPVRWMQGLARIDGSTSAMYSATISPAHRDGRIHLVIGLGDSSEDAPIEDRFSFAAEVWLEKRNGEKVIVIGFVDRSQVIIPPPESWGAFCSAQRMRTNGRRDEVLAIIDEILVKDARLTGYVLEAMQHDARP